jgi:hypothetical protein
MSMRLVDTSSMADERSERPHLPPCVLGEQHANAVSRTRCTSVFGARLAAPDRWGLDALDRSGVAVKGLHEEVDHESVADIRPAAP